jgi:hypothetical protein
MKEIGDIPGDGFSYQADDAPMRHWIIELDPATELAAGIDVGPEPAGQLGHPGFGTSQTLWRQVMCLVNFQSRTAGREGVDDGFGTHLGHIMHDYRDVTAGVEALRQAASTLFRP